MRVAIYHNLPSGGGKRALYEMARRLVSEHEIDVYTLSCAEHNFCDLRPHCSRHIVFPFHPLPLLHRPFGRLNQGVRALDLLRLCALQREIARRIDAIGYEVVFVHNCQYGVSPGLLSFLNTPSVYYCQEPPRRIYEPALPRPYTTSTPLQRIGSLFDPLPQLYRRLLASLDCRNVSATTAVLTNSAYSRESLFRVYGIFAKVCYLGVDAQRFRPLLLPKGDFVLSVGHLNARKGFDFLIRSLALLDDAQRPPLIIVSNFADHRERRYLEELASRLNVSVEFLTLVPHEKLVRLYNQARLTLYAPIMEPFGLVPLESLACGTPVVSVCEGGVRETILHNKTGLLTDRDPRCFAEAIKDLLSAPDSRKQFGHQGRTYVERQWQWDHTVRNLEKYLIDMIQHPSGETI